MNISEQLINDLIDQGVDTFFGIQGGACARLIDNVIKFKGKFIPVLNEQSAGYYAHGYYMSTKKTPGLIFTTGPGLTNGLSGIAACYYDKVPLVTLVGQVKKKLNIAKSTKTRMVGFQEVPHLELCNPISDICYKIDNLNKYYKFRNDFLKNLNSKVQVIEFLDDVQRMKLKKKFKKFKKTIIKEKFSFSKKNLKLIKISKNPVFILGSGFAQSENYFELLSVIKKMNIDIACTWGGQKIQKFLSKKDNFIGIMGNHSPGLANNIIKKSDLIIALGCSLLQHQVGKKYTDFAPKAKILYVNNDISECKRARFQFGKRLVIANLNSNNFVEQIKKVRKKKKIIDVGVEKKNISHPVKFLKLIFDKIDKNSIIFADAGATLSWTYQAANSLEKCPTIFTAFNLHPMGYANCAAIGASISKKKNVYCIIGDGSIPMNGQELSWIKKYPFKMIILDNNGYGIIRQTQREFYNSKFYGSDFLNKKSSIPNFSVEKILKSHQITYKKITKNKIKQNELNWLNSTNKPKALLIKIKYESCVIVEK